MDISIGILTDGKPIIKNLGEYNILQNQLIGRGFHWQKVISSKLPGALHLTGNPDFPLINTIDIETYLECVVGSEMNPKAPIEFLKAHAIISRSWAIGKVIGAHSYDNGGKICDAEQMITWEDNADHHDFHVCSDDHCQRYQGFQPLNNIAREAIKSTEGLVIADPSGQLVDARFSKCCGGQTETFDSCWQDVSPECLVSFNDPWCDLSKLNEKERDRILNSILKDYDLSTQGGFLWHTETSGSEIEQRLHAKFNRDIGRIMEIIPLKRGASGRISLMRLIGTKGTIEIGKELAIRKILSDTHLYSSWFDVDKLGQNQFRLTGRGWGHGVGLCQIGAAHMATRGYDTEQILKFYYPESQIIHISRIFGNS